MRWPFIKIGKVSERTDIRDPRKCPDDLFRYIDIASIDKEKKSIVSAQKLIGSEAPSRARKVIKTGDILVSTVRPNLNAVAIVPQELDNHIASTGFCILRAKTQVLAKYLYFFTLSNKFVDVLIAKVRGAHYPAVSDSDIRNVKIPLPTVSEQRRIVEILDQADHLRKMRIEADRKAKRILPALFIKMFGDPATNTKGWPVVPVSEMVVAPGRINPGQNPDKPFKYIDIAGVDGQTGLITEVKSLVGAEAPSRARQVVFENDVIISTVRPYLRATAIVPKYYDNQICSTGFCVLRIRSGKGFGYLYALTRLQWFTNQLNVRARGASYPAVSDQDILSLRVPFPDDVSILKKFDLCLQDILSLNDKRVTSYKKINFLFDIILHRAYSGDLTATWRQAHMKELLQEMEIQAKALAL